MPSVKEAVLVYQRGAGVPLPSDPLRDPRAVATFLRQVIPDGPAERFIAIAVDVKNRPVAWATIGLGGLGTCPVDIASVLRFVLLASGSAVIVAHNHPSGDPYPSSDDVELTRGLQLAATAVGLCLLDHVIVTHEPRDAFSFLQSGLL